MPIAANDFWGRNPPSPQMTSSATRLLIDRPPLASFCGALVVIRLPPGDGSMDRWCRPVMPMRRDPEEASWLPRVPARSLRQHAPPEMVQPISY